MVKKKGGKLKWVIIIIIVFAVIGAVTGDDEDKDKDKEQQTASSSNAESSEEEDSREDEQKQEKEAEPDNKKEENVIGVGETFENNGLKVTVNSFNPEYTSYNEYSAPKDGNKYIEVGFTYENVREKGDKYVSIYDCDCYADNSACEQAYIGEGDFINANISPGRNVTFNVYYEVPISAQTIELEYDSSFWNSEKVVIKLQ